MVTSLAKHMNKKHGLFGIISYLLKKFLGQIPVDEIKACLIKQKL